MVAKQRSEVAQCASMIRADLKRLFPGVAFTVRTKQYSMGNHVRVEWLDGPTDDQVQKAIAHYEYGRFDGMQDLYEYTNVRKDIPQCKYLICQRSYSRPAYIAIVDAFNQRYGEALQVHPDYNSITHDSDTFRPGHGPVSTDLHRFMHPMSLYCNQCHTVAHPADRYCAECGHEINSHNF